MGRFRRQLLVSHFGSRVAIVDSDMSEENHGVPTKGGSGGLIALGILLLAGAGGLVLWKTQSGGGEEVVVEEAPPAPAPKEEAAPVLDNAPPPPPTEEEIEEEEKKEEVSTAKTTKPSGPAGCSSPCNGSAPGNLQAALATRGGMARTCYNTALRRDPTIQGKMTVAVRLNPQGAVCSAAVTSNTSGDAALAACVGAKFRSAKFPAPAGGCVDVAVPLNFTSKQ